MQILNSLGEFFNFSQNKEESKFDLKSDSSTKVNFQDYLHDAMNEASTLETNHSLSNLHLISIPKPNLDSTEFRTPKENFSMGITLTSFLPTSESKEIIIEQTQENFSQIETHSVEVTEDTESENQVVEQNLETVTQEIETLPEKEIDSNEKNLSLFDENREINPSSTKIEMNLISDSEINLETNSPIEEEILFDLKSDFKEIQAEKKVAETIPLKEIKNTEINAFLSSKELLSSILDTEKKIPTGNSEKNHTKEVLSKENRVPVEKNTISNEAKNSLKEEIYLAESVKKEAPITISKEINSKEINKEKKESKKVDTLSLHSNEEKGNEKKMEIKQSASKEKQNANDSKEETILLDKSKWVIQNFSKKENQDIKKESLTSLYETSLKQNIELDKGSRLEISQNKIQSEIKPNEKMKDSNLQTDSQNFQKSLNELVQKAKVNILENGKNTAQIALYPKELGKMTLNIEVIQDKVDGKILVESESVKSLLLNDLNNLKLDLKSSGLDLASLSVEVRLDSSSNSGFEDKIAKRETEFEKEKENRTYKDSETEESSEMNFQEPKTKKLLDIKV
jgi:hypothetical protein